MLRDELHSLFADFTAAPGGPHEPVAVDVVDGPTSVEIRIDLLGFAPDDLEIEQDGDMVRLRGSRLIENDEAEAGNRRHNKKRWHFLRGIQIPPGLDAAPAETSYQHGLLTITLRKRPHASAFVR